MPTASPSPLALEHGQIPADTRSVLDDLLERLAADSLVVEVSDREASPGPAPEPSEAAGQFVATANPGYVVPRLEKFTDLSDYFLVDPIHDVGLAGWPNRPPEG